MLVLDFQLVLFVMLLLIASLIYLIVTAVSQQRQKATPLLPIEDETAVRQQLDFAPFGLLLLNARQEVVYSNRAGEILFTPEWADDLRQDVLQIQQGGASSSQLNSLMLPNDKAVSWWLAQVGEQTLAVVQDLTQQRQLERNSQLFLSSLSHELRTPLTAVLAHIEVMRTPDLPESVRENSLGQIHRETNRISRLVQNLLMLSRLETAVSLNIRPIDLLLITEEVMADIILAAEASGIQLSLQAETGMPRVLADPDRLKQVLINLLDNGVKYGRSGDRVEVQLSMANGGVQTRIQDSGLGIPEAQLPHITEKLYRGRTDVEGSGLGLAIVAEILRQHNSQLHIKSQTEPPDSGTAVWFTLPIDKK